MNADVATTAERTLRLWPGLVSVVLMWAAILVPGWVVPGSMLQLYLWMFGIPLLQLLFLIWWLFFTRIRWLERIGLLLVALAIGAVAHQLCHPSYKDMFLMFVPPMVMTWWVGWLFVSQWLRWPVRRAGLVITLLAAFGYYTLVRHDGTDGYFSQTLSFRWTQSPEEKYLARAAAVKPAAVDATKPLELRAGDWPGFRGATRDSRLQGIAINTNWKTHPPRELWRHEIGPGWSSFAVIGDLAFTQEQHGPKEAVVCYDAKTGNTVWVHHDEERFWEAIAGAGPRATPTFHDGKLYAMGASGRLNCLDAASGRVIWTRNIIKDINDTATTPKPGDTETVKMAPPTWGFSSSPLVANGIVTVFAGAPKDMGVLAFHAAAGEPAWHSSNAKLSYCSVQLTPLAGVEQLLLAGGDGMTAMDPTSGNVLWQYEWDMGEGMNRVVQPTVVSDTDVLLGTGFGNGMRRLHLERDADKWKVTEVWSSRAISPYYNDLVVYQDHIYGFDAGFLTCASLKDGKRKWKVRGYDNGQVLLLADQGVLLVQCEKGDVALVAANPERHEELARIKGLDGKTWNHPVIANGRLFVRNDQMAACFELKLDGDAKK